MIGWAKEELSGLDLEDARLTSRCIRLVETLGSNPQASIPAAVGKSWSETLACYRLLSNEKVTLGKVMGPHIQSTINRARKEKTVLGIQDTTEVDYSGHGAKEGIGPLNTENHQGLLLHPTVLVTPDQVPLGILKDHSWYRTELDKNGSHKQREIEDKESYRWLESYRKTQWLAESCPETQVINISDREGDIYEIFMEYEKNEGKVRCEYIIRGCQNRCLIGEAEDSAEKLWERLRGSPVLGEVEFHTPAGRGKKSRRVMQTIQAQEVTLRSPQSRRPRVDLPSVRVRVVLAEEVNPPEGEEPVTWLLLTSLSVDNFAAARQVISYYLCRWQIERFFFVLKKGCTVEELHLQNERSLQLCLRFYMIIAWRILYLTMLGRNMPNLGCELLFEDFEWKAIYVFVRRQPPPLHPPSLDEMIRLIASLGGFLNRKGDGFPGSQTIWIGLQRSIDITTAWLTFNEIKIGHTYV